METPLSPPLGVTRRRCLDSGRLRTGGLVFFPGGGDVGSLLLAVVALAASACFSACDFGSLSQPAVSSECAAVGAQCQLPGGPLGVCQEISCDPGASPPCFKCTSQH